MASRAILRRKRHLFNSLNRSTGMIWGFSCFDHGGSSQVSDSWDFTWSAIHPSENIERRSKGNSSSLTKEEVLVFSARGFLRHTAYGVPTSGYGIKRTGFLPPLGVRGIVESIRYFSNAEASRAELGGSNDVNDEKAVKQKKEASPEECDQAVEGLSTVKAKAKAKQLQESQKDATSVLKKVWAMLLGIGPALRAVASMSRQDWAKKLHHWKDEFKSTMQHYWLGTKLLWADVRISLRLLLKLASGKHLSRRERQQLTRTTADIFRLVPFAVFIIVPFMEFLLPVFLKLFPNMLPSTFQDKMKEQEALKKKLYARIEYAKFLQETVKEMAKEIQNSRSGEAKKTAEDLDEFMNKVRRGTRVSNEEILGFAKLFNDELTLDNISRPRLVNMCKYMGISPYGTDAYLRYMLRKSLQKIKSDDKMILAEGVESLSEEELRQACRDRGLLGLLSVDEMREQLRDWVDLSLNHSVPSSLLILSRAFSVSGKVKPEEAVQATLSSLPDEVVDTVGVTTLPSEDSVSERRRKLEFLEMQEELIKEEEEKEEEEQARMKESLERQKDVALEEMMLRPDVRRGNITLEEQLLILELHSRWGNRWSKIARQLPGRTDNEIKNYWRTRVQKHAKQLKCDVNSKQFKDTMRYLWMPRLVERIQAAAATSTGATTTGTATASGYNTNNMNNIISSQVMMPRANILRNNFEATNVQSINIPSFTPENSSTTASSDSFGISQVSTVSDHTDCDYNHPPVTNNQDYFQANQFTESLISPSGYYNPGMDFQSMEPNNPWIGGGGVSDNLWNVEDIWLLQQQFSNNI